MVAQEGPAGTRLVGYVAGGELDAEELKEQLAKQLPEYMVPGTLVRLEKLPLNANGKVDRKALPRVDATAGREYEAPQGRVEEALAAIWAEVLGVQRVGRRDNFFELGGHSLLLVKLLTLLQKHFGRRPLGLADIFNVPVLHAQAQRISSGSSDDVEVVHLHRGVAKGAGVPLYCLPGTYGNSTEYADLAAQIGMDRPVLGFVCHTLGEHRWTRKSIPEIAQACARFILDNTPGNACALLGWSFGGDLAYETARQLAGKVDVHFVGIVDVSDRKQIMALAAAGTVEAAPFASHPHVDDWIERSAMKDHWHRLLADMSPAERNIAKDLWAHGLKELPSDGPGIESKEYDMWVVARLAWMKRRYSHRGQLNKPLHVWTAEATSRDDRLILRPWSSFAEVQAEKMIAGTTHKSILSHPDFVRGLRKALQAADTPAATRAVQTPCGTCA